MMRNAPYTRVTALKRGTSGRQPLSGALSTRHDPLDPGTGIDEANCHATPAGQREERGRAGVDAGDEACGLQSQVDREKLA
jgi:hypothetical protein